MVSCSIYYTLDTVLLAAATTSCLRKVKERRRGGRGKRRGKREKEKEKGRKREGNPPYPAIFFRGLRPRTPYLKNWGAAPPRPPLTTPQAAGNPG